MGRWKGWLERDGALRVAGVYGWSLGHVFFGGSGPGVRSNSVNLFSFFHLPPSSTGAPFVALATFAEDLSCSNPVAESFRSSKSSFLNRSQVDSDDVPNRRREHLLAVSSFLFALIWGFGAHLPSRYLPGWGMGNAEG